MRREMRIATIRSPESGAGGESRSVFPTPRQRMPVESRSGESSGSRTRMSDLSQYMSHHLSGLLAM